MKTESFKNFNKSSTENHAVDVKPKIKRKTRKWTHLLKPTLTAEELSETEPKGEDDDKPEATKESRKQKSETFYD